MSFLHEVQQFYSSWSFHHNRNEEQQQQVAFSWIENPNIFLNSEDILVYESIRGFELSKSKLRVFDIFVCMHVYIYAGTPEQ